MSLKSEDLVIFLWLAGTVLGFYLLWPGCSTEAVRSGAKKSIHMAKEASSVSQGKVGFKSQSGREIVQTAYSQIGKEYVWGGESPGNGFDCSGFVWWVYRQHGIYLPRISGDQYHAGTTVRSHLAPGDLVFFRSSLGKGRYHVGIFTGGYSFIHAPKTGGVVRVEPISNKWRRLFLGARRVI